MKLTRGFQGEAAFGEWHESVKAELGLPRTSVNAATGQPDPATHPTTDWTELVTEEAVTDEDGTVIEMLPVTPHAVTADAIHLADVATLRHVIFGALVLLYVLTLGQNWAHYSAAVMVCAWVRHDGRLTTRV